MHFGLELGQEWIYRNLRFSMRVTKTKLDSGISSIVL